MTNHTVAIIGAGNMARSLAGGLLANDWPPDRLRLADPDPGQRQGAEQALGIRVFDSNTDCVQGADVVVLAVKPQALKAVAQELQPVMQTSDALVISVAAGVREADIERWLGGSRPLVRVMPNTPALIKSGASGLHANRHTSAIQRDLAESIMRATGVTVWVEDEALMDTVTALSGSGPAYFFLVMEALEIAAIEQGLEPAAARLLTLETALGAARMALESDESPQLLRKRVTSPGGTTERAIEALENGGLRELLAEAIKVASARSRELAEMFGEK